MKSLIIFATEMQKWALILLTCWVFGIAQAQDKSPNTTCNISITGKIIDAHTDQGLPLASVSIVELEKGVYADTLGQFTLQNICPGTYTLRWTHVGCSTKDSLVTIVKDENIYLYLEHQFQELIETEIVGKTISSPNIEISQSLKNIYLKDPSKDLGVMLSTITGVNVLQSGSNVFKPIIHGLHSDRLLIIQNNVKLSGQSWGAEHAPEIDASSAYNIQVVKGIGSIEYGTDGIGGAIIIHQTSKDFDTTWSGTINTSFNTNQIGIATHARTSKGWNWKKNQKSSIELGGTFKKFGDAKAPRYVLTNSGLEEKSAFGAWNYQKVNEKYLITSQTFYNYYFRRTGILEASHIGNIEDLKEAIESDIPKIIRNWSYSIGYPNQMTQHHTLKQQLDIETPWAKFHIQYDLQKDRRKEFDNRRNGRSDLPVLDLQLYTHHLSTKISKKIQQFTLFSGLEYYYKSNTNIPGTGFRPIIPNFTLHNSAIWARTQWIHKRVSLESGFRYENHQLSVAAFDKDNVLYKPNHNFHTFALMLNGEIQISKLLNLISNFKISSRTPNINELYSSGVHQSAAAIEYGDNNIIPERSFKWTNRFALAWTNRARLDITPYLHFINGYIYLQPQDEFETTIRGAFPVFKYLQLDAVGIAGLDADLTFYPIVNLIKLQAQYSFIRMTDIATGNDLIGTPPNQLKFTGGIERSHWKKLTNIYVGIEWKYVGEQLFVSDENDFLPPPKAYHLLSFNSNIDWNVKSKIMGVGIQINNMTNRSYRDYLDRFRYFADLPGINCNIKWHFNF